MGTLVLSVSLVLVGLAAARVARGDVSLLRLANLGAALLGAGIGVRLLTPSRHDTD